MRVVRLQIPGSVSCSLLCVFVCGKTLREREGPWRDG